ncbi:diacylglycerol/lipid kinase family protein [Aestuariivirga litoralis]|uniref:diacylglycerol/lipid kinase family protein n=1 Tax=Aestuariivirga litoralis TaxID=2650924 RepID=UPI0018C6C810|nr:diacylglycerol kinase family protein [Aestuariivirga litoralis]
MKTLVIINPTAGGGRAGRQWLQHAPALQNAIGAFDTAFTSLATGAIALAGDAATQGYERVIAIGGDGTVNEVVNGLARASGDRPVVPLLGVIGMGTGNDFARANGIKGGWKAGIVALREGAPRVVDLGLVHFTGADGAKASRWFANCADLGLIGEVVADAQDSKLRRMLGSKLAYPLHAVLVLRRYKGHRIKYEAEDGTSHEREILAVAVANGRTFGGGMKIAPAAKLDDGLLDVIVIAKEPRVRATDLRLLYAGTHLNLPAITHFQTRRVRFETVDGSTMLCDADGELLGKAPCEIEVVKGKIKVVGVSG